MLIGNDYQDDEGNYYELLSVAKMDNSDHIYAVYLNSQNHEYYVCLLSEFEKRFRPVQ